MPPGDSKTAPDITAVTATHDAAGNLTFTVRTSHAALAADSLVDIALDTDQNPDTGGNGVEFFFLISSSGWEFARWDGSKFTAAGAPSANGSYANGVATFKISKADLGGVEKFTWWADSFQLDANGNVIAEDTAPEGTNAYTYALTPLTLRASTAAAVPAKPVAGKAFTVGTRVTRGRQRRGAGDGHRRVHRPGRHGAAPRDRSHAERRRHLRDEAAEDREGQARAGDREGHLPGRLDVEDVLRPRQVGVAGSVGRRRIRLSTAPYV